MNHPETTKPQDKQSICLCSLRAACSQATLADSNVCVTMMHLLRGLLGSFFSFSYGSPLNSLVGIVATFGANLGGSFGLWACHRVGWCKQLCKCQFIEHKPLTVCQTRLKHFININSRHPYNSSVRCLLKETETQRG